MQDAVIGHMQKSITKQSLNYAIFQNKNLILMIKIKQFLLKIEPPKPQKVGPYFLYNVTFTDNISYVLRSAMRSIGVGWQYFCKSCTRTQFIVIVNKVSRFWFGFLIADVSDVDHVLHRFHWLVVFVHVGRSNG